MDIEMQRLFKVFGNSEKDKFYAKHCHAGRLDLSNKAIKDKDISSLVDFLNRHPEINYLDLSLNQVTCKAATKLAKNKTIWILDISWTAISNKGLKALAKSSNIQTLNISFDPYIDYHGFEYLQQSKVLTKIYIDNMVNITQDDGPTTMIEIPTQFSGFQNHLQSTICQQQKKMNDFHLISLDKYFPLIISNVILNFLAPVEILKKSPDQLVKEAKIGSNLFSSQLEKNLRNTAINISNNIMLLKKQGLHAPKVEFKLHEYKQFLC